MSRVTDLVEGMDKLNRGGGVPKDEWYMLLLTDIALSLATIADELKEGDTQ